MVFPWPLAEKSVSCTYSLLLLQFTKHLKEKDVCLDIVVQLTVKVYQPSPTWCGLDVWGLQLSGNYGKSQYIWKVLNATEKKAS